MAESIIVTLRLPRALLERADDLVPRLRENDEMVAMGRVSRSTVLRLAVLRGLEVLQAEAPEARRSSPAGRSRNG